ncbi:MAG: NAD-dependent epimerase/dehydratase family protein [Candidatus Paceibacterota bacterium]
MLNILVTGGSGMVGSAIKELIKNSQSEDNYTFISSSDCDLREKDQVDKCFSDGNYDSIIHLAAIVGGLYKNMEFNVEMLMDNLKINVNVLEACHKYNVNRGIFCLSSCIYPKHSAKFPMTEDMICSNEPHESNEGYAYAKRMLYIMCKHYNKQYHKQYICLSPVNLYGINDNFNIKDGHVIPGLINRMFKTKNKIEPYHNKKFEVYGTGIAYRQFLLASDFASILIKFLHNNKIRDGLYNICDDNEYQIRDVLLIIARRLNYDVNDIMFNDNYSDGILRKTVSNNKFRDLFPDFEFTELTSGLNTTIYWFLNNLDKMRG